MISGSEVDNCSSDIEPVRKKPRIDTFIERSSEIVQEPNSNRKEQPIKLDTMGHGHVRSAHENHETNSHSENILDENLYSRQIYTLGESAMMHLRKSSVLVSGIGSVGVEIAKNLILGGVRQVTLHDTANAQWIDLSAQYYLNQKDLGHNRAAASFEYLAELNDSVTCSLSVDALTEDFVKKFELIVLADSSLSVQLMVNEWARKHGRYFLSAGACGLFAYIFLDCGINFKIADATGEKCKEVMIEHIDKETGDVATLEDAIHGFESGDHVTFSEVVGMAELNGIDPIEIKVKSPSVFNIGTVVKEFSPYVEGGRAIEIKVPKYVTHKSLVESLKTPEFLVWDFAHADYPRQLHLLWQALHAYEAKYNRKPLPRDDNDVLLLKAELPLQNDVEISEDLLKNFSYQARGNLAPVASIVGGFAAQEAMKAVTHHMTPLNQFLYIHCLDALPGKHSDFNTTKMSAQDYEPKNSRYDGQIAVFGHKYQEALMSQKFFIVGAGAIGCELLKNLAMMGVACGDGGKIKITDMDQIEISNLNRQFLFRKKDVGSNKASVAAKTVLNFNRDLKIEAYKERVSIETESIFNDQYFADLNGVINALDNVDARRYMDRRCVFYRLPLLESGTLGTKGNTQVVYPYLTESYSSSVDPPEKEIPICTLKNFPNEIHHTIQWARDLFETLFKEPAELSARFHQDPRLFLTRLDQMNGGQRIQILEQLIESVADKKTDTIEKCVAWARNLFQEIYHNNIAQLLHTFPPDQLTDHGGKFWSGTKRCPHVLEFDCNKEEHFNFVYSASLLRAQQYSVQPVLDRKEFISLISKVQVQPFIPKANVKIAVNDSEQKQQNEEIEDSNEKLVTLKIRLGKLKTKDLAHPVPIDFEKDDDSNHHIEFITAASNLRAENYDIQPADRMKTKQIAGRIIPAIATTTSVVAGLVMVELYKLILNASGKISRNIPLSTFKCAFLNLALPFVGFGEPIAASEKKYNEKVFTLWDRLEVKGPLTLSQFIDWVQEETGLKVSMISSGVSLIYSFFMNAAKRAERMKMELRSVVEDVSRQKLPAYVHSIVLEVVVTDENDADVEVPYVLYVF